MRPVCESVSPRLPDAIAIPTLPAAIDRIRLLDGPFKERQDLHRRHLLAIDPDRLLAPFRLQAGLPLKAERYGGWESKDISGHSLGHYLSAIAYLFAATREVEARRRAAYIVAELRACQEANRDGYALPVDKRAFEDVRVGRIEASPFALNGVWVPNYTLHKVLAGLRDAYRLCGIADALDAAMQLASWLSSILENLSAAQIQEMLKTEHGGMNEVLADLGADSGDRRLLEMAARWFHHDAVLAPMLRGEDRLNGLHGNTQIPKVVGLAREHELTATPEYRLAAQSFWEHVVCNRSYANGGHGESEHFFPPEKFPGHLTPNTCETCNTYNMLKLTRHLFAWEPQARQMDFVERAMINHLLANIGRAPGEFGYFLGLGAVGVKAFSTPYDSWWCCVGTGLENPVRYAEQIYFTSRDQQTLWVNLYVGSTLAWTERGVAVQQETRFPDDDRVRFTFSCDVPTAFTLNLRHPYWCARPVVRLNGVELDATATSTPSSYLSLTRTWRGGDMLEVQLPMALRCEPLPHSGEKIVAVMYGPIVLAGIVPPVVGVPDPAKLRFSDHLSSRGKTDAFPPLFLASDLAEVVRGLNPTGRAFAEFRSDGVVAPEDLLFKPFHRVYEEHYAVYFPVMSRDEWGRRQGELRLEAEQRARLAAATLDKVEPGFQQSEVEHAFRSERAEIRDFLDRKCREALRGGWFSYEMAVAADAPAELVVTYWGGEWVVRTFDIQIDGETIATQRLRTNRPGDFLEETYPIPHHLTRGKTRITVRFQAHPGDIAGGVFGLRTMKRQR